MPQAFNFIGKETPAQMFSCTFCEIFKNPFFRTPLVVASGRKGVTYQIFHLKLFSAFYYVLLREKKGYFSITGPCVLFDLDIEKSTYVSTSEPELLKIITTFLDHWVP